MSASLTLDPGGQPPDRLAVLPAWRETTYFSEQERAALVRGESVTVVTQDHVPDTVGAAASAVHLSEAQPSRS